MPSTTTIQIRSKGSITLPIELRRKYRLNEGDAFTLIDMGDGSFLLTPTTTLVDRFGDRVAQAMEKEGVSLEEMLDALDEEREQFYAERYVKD